MPSLRRLLVFVCAAHACACGPGVDFRQARHLEDSRSYPQAVKAYELFLEKHPRDARVPEALYRAGRIYASDLELCPRAAALLERAARLSSSAGPWPDRARAALLDCPDYFPLIEGAVWTYVDSQSQGKNMRLEVRLAGGQVSGAYYAGKKKFRDYRRGVSKEDWSVWESEGASRLPILKYPFQAGRSWSASDGRRTVLFLIEREGLEVKTQAGTFSGCLKVKRRVPGDLAWVYDYYCPGAGRVKTTIGVAGGENPNTELSSFDKMRR